MQRPAASFFSLVLLAMSVSALPVYAQSIGNTDTQPLTVAIDPAYPAPYQTVSVTPTSNSFNLAASSVSVTVNGVSVYKGSGSQAVPVTLGGPGTATTINVVVVNTGKTYSQKMVIRPASVALVVEPSSTSHVLYEGRNLVSAHGQVRLVAVPDIRTSTNAAVSLSSLVYTWKLGDQILEDASGIGKNVLTASAPDRYRDAIVTVTVSTQDGSISAQAMTSISPVDPFVRVYKNDPLMGPFFDTALSGSVAMSDTEDTYRAVPYYFATTPALTWSVNGTDSGTDPDITVRSSGGGQGTAVLGVSAKQSNPLLTAVATISVLFGQKSSTNIFGL